LNDLIDSMVPLVPADGGLLAENGSFVESTDGFMPFDIQMWAGIAPNDHLVFYIEGPTDVVTHLAFEFDGVASDGRTTVVETGLVGDGGPYPPWTLTVPKGTLITLDESPITFDPLPERIGGIVTTDITSAADFTMASNWLYAAFNEAKMYTYGHYEFLLEELRSRLNLVTLGELAEIRADLDEYEETQQILESLDSDEGSVAWIDATSRFAADLSLQKTAAQLEVERGGTATFFVTITNDGPQSAANVIVSDNLDPCLAFISSTTERGSYDPLTGEWSVGEVAVGESIVLQIDATIGDDCEHPVVNNTQVIGSSLPDPDGEFDLFSDRPAEDDIASVVITIPEG